ncbi:hypothetical protein KOW79_010451 [Hemibagrus wyckioides]|uniref:Uncharacterized protein n=1 Tax=Hemibagrus wyckioides TaxID=337641 RepID=A0A9D3SKK6_9TELE|nr:hypothetical protein KOW79_010451 [Hemibagrus wyckioides]
MIISITSPASEDLQEESVWALVDAVWVVWSIGASIYDYIHTSAMEERIHTLESAVTLHESVIGLLTAALVALVTYILLRKH